MRERHPRSETQVIPSPIPDNHPQDAGQSAFHMARCEVVAGAILRAARTSARMTEACLAAASAVSEDTIRAWENGSQPLTAVPAPRLEQLKHVLMDAGAEPGVAADLDAGVWCDLIILAIAAADDCACLAADPLTCENAFRELLAWSLTGQVPARYRRYVSAGPLITDPALTVQITAVLGSIRPDLFRHPA